MNKRENKEGPDSCWNKADDDETLFILLARDEAGPETVNFWCDERIRLGLNKETDLKIHSARRIARQMKEEFQQRKARREA